MPTTISVEGMTCRHCEQTVAEALQGVPDATDVSVEREREEASVDGHADAVDLVEAVEDAGYTAHVRVYQPEHAGSRRIHHSENVIHGRPPRDN